MSDRFQKIYDELKEQLQESGRFKLMTDELKEELLAELKKFEELVSLEAQKKKFNEWNTEIEIEQEYGDRFYMLGELKRFAKWRFMDDKLKNVLEDELKNFDVLDTPEEQRDMLDEWAGETADLKEESLSANKDRKVQISNTILMLDYLRNIASRRWRQRVMAGEKKRIVELFNKFTNNGKVPTANLPSLIKKLFESAGSPSLSAELGAAAKKALTAKASASGDNLTKDEFTAWYFDTVWPKLFDAKLEARRARIRELDRQAADKQAQRAARTPPPPPEPLNTETHLADQLNQDVNKIKQDVEQVKTQISRLETEPNRQKVAGGKRKSKKSRKSRKSKKSKKSKSSRKSRKSKKSKKSKSSRKSRK
jgi:hypothetical protein